MSGSTTKNMFAGCNAGLGYSHTGVGMFGKSDPSAAEVRNLDLNMPTIQDDLNLQKFLALGP